MSFFNVKYEGHAYQLIPIGRILWTNAMIHAVHSHGIELHNPMKCMQCDDFPLNRDVDAKVQAMTMRVTFPPISAKFDRQSDTYEVLDGRHRVVASVLNHYTHIPVTVTEIVPEIPVHDATMDDDTAIGAFASQYAGNKRQHQVDSVQFNIIEAKRRRK